MNIAFKLPNELQNIKSGYFQDGRDLPENIQNILLIIGQFIIERLKIISDEIEEEEIQGVPCMIAFNFSNPDLVEYWHYSNSLKNKMKESITKSDLAYLHTLIK